MRSRTDERAGSDRRRLLRWTGWFFLLNAAGLALVFARNLAVVELSPDLAARLFAFSMLAGHAMLVSLPAFLVVAAAALLFPRPALVMPAAAAISTVVLGAAWIDTVVFQQYRFHLNAEVYALLTGGDVGDVLQFSSRTLVRFTLLVVGFVALETLAARWIWVRVAALRRPRLARTLIALALALVGIEHGLHAWADAVGHIPVTRLARILPACRPLTAGALLRRMGLAAEREAMPRLADDPGTILAYPLEPVRCAATTPPRDIVWIVIDSFRADALDPAVTPNVSRLAERCLRFTDHWSGGSATRTGIFSLFYAIPGTYWAEMLGERRGPVFLRELLARGYEPGIFASASLENPEFDRTVFSDLEPLRIRTEGRRARERDLNLTRDFERFLAERDPARPLFAFVFYDAPHAYDLPPEAPQPFQPSWEEVDYLALGPDFDPEPFRNRYLNSVHWVDSLVGRVLAALDAAGKLDESLVLVTGDHGQEFNEGGQNYWGHNSNFTRYQAHVPLLLQWPGRPPATFTHRTSHYDVVPTLMRDLLGCDTDFAAYSVGHDLFEPGGRELLLLSNYTDYAVVLRDRILRVSPHGVEMLDSDYRPLPDEPYDREALFESLRLRSRFYRR